MINVVDEDGEFEVWLDPDGGFQDGLCIGCGKTRLGALSDARKELRSELTQLSKLWTKELSK